MATTFDLDTDDVIPTSAKTGEGIDEVSKKDPKRRRLGSAPRGLQMKKRMRGNHGRKRGTSDVPSARESAYGRADQKIGRRADRNPNFKTYNLVEISVERGEGRKLNKYVGALGRTRVKQFIWEGGVVRDDETREGVLAFSLVFAFPNPLVVMFLWRIRRRSRSVVSCS